MFSVQCTVCVIIIIMNNILLLLKMMMTGVCLVWQGLNEVHNCSYKSAILRTASCELRIASLALNRLWKYMNMADMEGEVEGFFVSSILMTFKVKFRQSKFVSTRFPSTSFTSYWSVAFFFFFLTTRVELMTLTQKKMLQYGRDENRPLLVCLLC
jgi:hypothetical protein